MLYLQMSFGDVYQGLIILIAIKQLFTIQMEKNLCYQLYKNLI